jgi:spore coat polysaccharide biosynthesis protein SpsF
MSNDYSGTFAIVQARMGSSRLPGKVLREVAGKPILQYLLERLQRARRLSGVVVATSTDAEDMPIVELCERLGVEVFRGDQANVASRFLDVIKTRAGNAFVRISGDSPLLDPSVVDLAVGRFLTGDCDVVTNLMPRSYPRGQSVEVVRSQAFREAYLAMSDRDHFEHVTRWFYEHADQVKIVNFGAERDRSDIRLVVDTAADLNRIASIVMRMERPHWQYELSEIIEIYDSVNVEQRASAR